MAMDGREGVGDNRFEQMVIDKHQLISGSQYSVVKTAAELRAQRPLLNPSSGV